MGFTSSPMSGCRTPLWCRPARRRSYRSRSSPEASRSWDAPTTKANGAPAWSPSCSRRDAALRASHCRRSASAARRRCAPRRSTRQPHGTASRSDRASAGSKPYGRARTKRSAAARFRRASRREKPGACTRTARCRLPAPAGGARRTLRRHDGADPPRRDPARGLARPARHVVVSPAAHDMHREQRLGRPAVLRRGRPAVPADRRLRGPGGRCRRAAGARGPRARTPGSSKPCGGSDGCCARR